MIHTFPAFFSRDKKESKRRRITLAMYHPKKNLFLSVSLFYWDKSKIWTLIWNTSTGHTHVPFNILTKTNLYPNGQLACKVTIALDKKEGKKFASLFRCCDNEARVTAGAVTQHRGINGFMIAAGGVSPPGPSGRRRRRGRPRERGRVKIKVKDF